MVTVFITIVEIVITSILPEAQCPCGIVVGHIVIISQLTLLYGITICIPALSYIAEEFLQLAAGKISYLINDNAYQDVVEVTIIFERFIPVDGKGVAASAKQKLWIRIPWTVCGPCIRFPYTIFISPLMRYCAR